MADILVPKSSKKFQCNSCDYICSRESQYNRHIATRKHKNAYIRLTNADILVPKSSNFTCHCGNVYKHRQSLSKHKKNCALFAHTSKNDTSANISLPKSYVTSSKKKNDYTSSDDISISNSEQMIQVVTQLINQNQDFMKDVVGDIMKIVPIVTNHTTNSHNTTNNQLNIQMFLNDHCKNAMNLTDFIHSLPITSETYDSTIENGLTKTITNMMVNGLNELDILERPIHCTDATRRTLYIKDADKWERDSDLLHVLKGIKELSLKQRTMINKWKEVNDGWKTDDKLQSRMTSLVFNSMTQIENDEKETSKIIRSISKNVYLNNETKKGYSIQ